MLCRVVWIDYRASNTHNVTYRPPSRHQAPQLRANAPFRCPQSLGHLAEMETTTPRARERLRRAAALQLNRRNGAHLTIFIPHRSSFAVGNRPMTSI